MSQQGLRQASLRAATGAAETYDGDWLRLFDAAGIPDGLFNERMLRWINQTLGASYAGLPEAQAAYAASLSVYNFSAIGSFDAQSEVGGIAIGAEGDLGSLYEGYTLSWGDDFSSLNIVGPQTPRGRYFTTKGYSAGPRGQDTTLGTMFDTDPLMTGHDDSNRGVAVGYDNMSVADSILSLQARDATAGEQAHMSSTRNELAAMIHSAGAILFNPDAEDTGDIILEALVQYPDSAPNGWHPTFWTFSGAPLSISDNDEIDFEGNSAQISFGSNRWTGGSRTSGPGAVAPVDVMDGTFHKVTLVLNKTNFSAYIDDVLHETVTGDANTKDLPQYFLLTSHVYNGTFDGEDYSAAQWNSAGATGATFAIDWVRVWRRTGKAHYEPLVNVDDVDLAYGDSVDIVIPAKATLWGDGAVDEYIQVIPHEENEPGMDHSTLPGQFPSGVTWNAGTRTLSVDISSGKTGRLNVSMHAWTAGSTCEPLRFAVNVGPRWLGGDVQYTEDTLYTLDLYDLWDCGVLTPGKVITATNLPSGMTYDAETYTISGTSSVVGDNTVTTTCTNSAGQVEQATFNLEGVAAGGTPPTFVGTAAHSTNTAGANVTPTLPTHTTDDILVLVTESHNNQTHATPSGWTLKGRVTGAFTTLAVYWLRAVDGSTAAVSFASATDHTIGKIYCFRGCVTSGDPFEASANDFIDSGSTSATIPAVTTLGPNRLILDIIAWNTDSAGPLLSAWANANLESITEAGDQGTTSGSGGGAALAYGVKASAGSTGTTTATVGASATQSRWKLALAPA